MLILSLKAMTKSQNSKQLQRPEWKAKRLEILERDGNKCVKCGETKRLHVHHLSYTKGRDAWEYPNDNLVTLCNGCHLAEHPDKGMILPKVSGYKTFEDFLPVSFKLSYGEYRLLMLLLTRLQYNTNVLVLSLKMKDAFRELLGIKKQSLSNNLSGLRKLGILFYDRGSWEVNPLYFWKGDSEERIKRLNATH